VTTHPTLTSESTAELRAELAQLRARYDGGALAPAVFAIVKALEAEIAWIEHCREARP